MENAGELMAIKAFADAAGRSQQAIYKQISTRLAPYVHESGGKKYIERRALAEVFNIGADDETKPEFNQFNSTNQPEFNQFNSTNQPEFNQFNSTDSTHDNVEQLLRALIKTYSPRQDEADHPLYAILQAELEAKNRQIEQLQKELAEERKHSREQAAEIAKLADQAQKLHAGTIQTQLPSPEETPINPEPEAVATDKPPAEPDRKWKFLKWLMGQ